jgi:hypothetical protein
MKKNVYISPSVEIEDYETGSDLLVASPTGTNIDDLDVANGDAPTDMEGRSRRNRNVWEDEDVLE